MKIFNRWGELIVETPDEQRTFLSELSLPNAKFFNLELEGAFFDDCVLTGANFAGADLYGTYFTVPTVVLQTSKGHVCAAQYSTKPI